MYILAYPVWWLSVALEFLFGTLSLAFTYAEDFAGKLEIESSFILDRAKAKKEGRILVRTVKRNGKTGLFR